MLLEPRGHDEDDEDDPGVPGVPSAPAVQRAICALFDAQKLEALKEDLAASERWTDICRIEDLCAPNQDHRWLTQIDTGQSMAQVAAPHSSGWTKVRRLDARRRSSRTRKYRQE